MKMITEKILNPYSLPATFRAYVYDAVILAKETQSVNINTSTFNKNVFLNDCELNLLMVETLDEVQLHDLFPWPEGEFFIFHRGKENGYSVLFKRLRDTFAHGDYESRNRDWITIRHRYKGDHEKTENTRAFGNFKITTLKKLIKFLDQSDDQNI